MPNHRLAVPTNRHPCLGVDTAAAGAVLKSTAGDTQAWVAIGGDASGAPDALTVTRLQTRAVGNIAPANNQVLTWSTANNRWEPAPGGLSGTGTNESTWIVNADAAAGTNEDACVRLLAGDGLGTPSLWRGEVCVVTATGVLASAFVQVDLQDDGIAAADTEVHLGPFGATASRVVSLILNSASAGVAKRLRIRMEPTSGGIVEFNDSPDYRFNLAVAGDPVATKTVWIRSTLAGAHPVLRIHGTTAGSGFLAIGTSNTTTNRLRIEDDVVSGVELVHLAKTVDQDVAVLLRSGAVGVNSIFGWDFSASRWCVYNSGTALDAAIAPLSFASTGAWFPAGQTPIVGSVIGATSATAAPAWSNILDLKEQGGGTGRGTLRFDSEAEIPKFGNGATALWHLTAHPSYQLSELCAANSAAVLDETGFLAGGLVYQQDTSSVAYDAGGRRLLLTTSAVLDNDAFWRSANSSIPLGNRPLLRAKFRTGATIADIRIFVGIMSSADPDGAVDADDPVQAHVGLQFSNLIAAPRDVNWQFTHGAADPSPQTLVNTNVVPAVNTIYHLEIDVQSDGVRILIRLLDQRYVELASASLVTNLPSGSEFNWLEGCSNMATAVKSLGTYQTRIALRHTEE